MHHVGYDDGDLDGDVVGDLITGSDFGDHEQVVPYAVDDDVDVDVGVHKLRRCRRRPWSCCG